MHSHTANPGMAEKHLFTEEQWAGLVPKLGLTERQSIVVQLLISGKSDRQIASQLQVSVPTVRAHFQRIFTTLGVSDRTALVVEIFRAYLELTGSSGGPGHG